VEGPTFITRKKESLDSFLMDKGGGKRTLSDKKDRKRKKITFGDKSFDFSLKRGDHLQLKEEKNYPTSVAEKKKRLHLLE